MKFSNWSQHHRRSILFLLLMLALGGVVSMFRMPVALFPRVSFPRVVIELDAGDRPAQQMDLQVTRPVEQAVRAVPGVRDIRSTTSRGSAEIKVNFGWGRNMTDALLEVESAINQVLPGLPRGTRFQARRMDPTVDPVAAYSLTSDTLSLVQLRNIAEYQLMPLLSSVNGVARIGVQGGETEEYQVIVNPAALEAYGLTLQQVAAAVSAQNVLTAVGRVEDRYKLFLILSDTRFRNLDQIRHTILRSGPNGLVELGEVARVRRGHVPQWVRVTADGHNAVLLNIYQQMDGNTVRIVRDIKRKLAGYRRNLPAGLTIHNWYDQSVLVTNAAGSVRDAIIIGVVLAALVLLAFLRNLKILLIAVIVVPAVLSATVLLLYVLHMSFNIMTLGGMAAAVGLIIDDAIVMIEHIVRTVRGGGGDHRGRVLKAAREFTRPLAGSSASTIIIFVPLAFLGGVTGAFFKALSLTIAAALSISFLVSWLAVPLLADHLLGEKDALQEEGGRVTAWFHRRYREVLARLLARPRRLLAILLAFAALGYLGYREVGSGFMPVMDEGGFVLDYVAPPGTSLTETNRLLDQVERILRSTPEVQTYSRRTGLQLGGGVTEANEGDFFVRLKPPPRRPIWAVMESVRKRVLSQVPGLQIDMAQLMEDLIGDLTAVPQPIEVKLYGDDPGRLLKVAVAVAHRIEKVPGVVDVRDGIVYAGDALDVRISRSRAALEGIDPQEVTRELRTELAGTVTTHVQRGIRTIGIRVWTPRDIRRTIPQIERLPIQAPDGHVFPLGRVANVSIVTGQPELTGENLKRMVAVTARIQGRDLGSTVRDVRRALDTAGLIPRSVYYELGGLYKQQQIAFKGLMGVFAAAVGLVFLLLLFLYERLRTALIIMSAPLLSVGAIFLGLWATRTELNISSMMGMTMVIGIVTEVAIFYFSEYESLSDALPIEERLIEAGINRLRPIAMTTFAFILALLPLALAIGQGAQMQQPLAIAIISGLLVQMPMVLLVMPVLFYWINRRR